MESSRTQDNIDASLREEKFNTAELLQDHFFKNALILLVNHLEKDIDEL
jgi:hypothetical protein